MTYCISRNSTIQIVFFINFKILKTRYSITCHLSIQQCIINHFSTIYIIVNSMYINLNLYEMNSKTETKSINIKNISMVNSKLLKFRETLRIITNQNLLKTSYLTRWIFLKKKKRKEKINANRKINFFRTLQLITFLYSSQNKSIISYHSPSYLSPRIYSKNHLSIHISQTYNISCETLRDYTQEYDAVPRPF